MKSSDPIRCSQVRKKLPSLCEMPAQERSFFLVTEASTRTRNSTTTWPYCLVQFPYPLFSSRLRIIFEKLPQGDRESERKWEGEMERRREGERGTEREPGHVPCSPAVLLLWLNWMGLEDLFSGLSAPGQVAGLGSLFFSRSPVLQSPFPLQFLLGPNYYALIPKVLEKACSCHNACYRSVEQGLYSDLTNPRFQ